MIVPMAGRGGAAPFSSINGPNHPLAPWAIWAISEKKTAVVENLEFPGVLKK